MSRHSGQTLSKSFELCWLLCFAFSVPGLVPGLVQGLDDTEAVLALVTRANENRGFTKDGVELFQGDIIMRPEIGSEIKSMGLVYPFAPNTHNAAKRTRRPKRAAMSNKARRWMGRDGRPEIPYVIEPNNFANHTRQAIYMAMQHWKKHVPCLRFVRRTKQWSYLSFYSGVGCLSDVGRTGGRQLVSIGPGCGLFPTIIHEIGHALGFWHEQSRPDRDNYVRINWNGIQREYRYAFSKYADGRINSLGVPYDYDSIMHYDSTAFGQGRTTMRRKNGDKRLGNKKGLSRNDIKQAKLLYCVSGGIRSTGVRRPTARRTTARRTKVYSKVCSRRYRDLSYWCRYWKTKGYCASTSSRYTNMSKNCKKTCFCGKKKTAHCQDKTKTCSVWSKRGYCKRGYKKYMEANCKKSCRLCT